MEQQQAAALKSRLSSMSITKQQALSLTNRAGHRIHLDSARERARISAERFIRREYARPGKQRRQEPYGFDWHPLATALVLEFEEIALLSGETLRIEAVYATEGYHTLLGGTQHPDGSWTWSVWAD